MILDCEDDRQSFSSAQDFFSKVWLIKEAPTWLSLYFEKLIFWTDQPQVYWENSKSLACFALIMTDSQTIWFLRDYSEWSSYFIIPELLIFSDLLLWFSKERFIKSPRGLVRQIKSLHFLLSPLRFKHHQMKCTVLIARHLDLLFEMSLRNRAHSISIFQSAEEIHNLITLIHHP